MSRLTLERRTVEHGRRKTRVFSVELVALLVDTYGTPLLVAYAASEQAERVFTASFRHGTVAVTDTTRLEIEDPDDFVWQREVYDGVAVQVAYRPEMFHVAPGKPVEPDQTVRFVFAPPRWWVEQEAKKLAPEHGEDAVEVAQAVHFAAFLDRRVSLPIPPDPAFQLELWRAAREEPWCQQRPSSGLDQVGLGSPWIVHASGPQLAHWLREQLQGRCAVMGD